MPEEKRHCTVYGKQCRAHYSSSTPAKGVWCTVFCKLWYEMPCVWLQLWCTVEMHCVQLDLWYARAHRMHHAPLARLNHRYTCMQCTLKLTCERCTACFFSSGQGEGRGGISRGRKLFSTNPLPLLRLGVTGCRKTICLSSSSGSAQLSTAWRLGQPR